jgi:hypothetical protein
LGKLHGELGFNGAFGLGFKTGFWVFHVFFAHVLEGVLMGLIGLNGFTYRYSWD